MCSLQPGNSPQYTTTAKSLSSPSVAGSSAPGSSLTSSLGWDKHLNDVSTIHFGIRNYLQSRAFFFKPVYDQPETYMTVDSKLDRGFSNEFEFRLSLQGHDRWDIPQLLRNNNIQYNIYVALYHRHTETPNWFSDKKDLISLITSFGIQYHF